MTRPALVELVCSWCGLRAQCVVGHDGGQRVAICSACAHTAAEVHAEHAKDTAPPPRREAPRPRLVLRDFIEAEGVEVEP